MLIPVLSAAKPPTTAADGVAAEFVGKIAFQGSIMSPVLALTFAPGLNCLHSLAVSNQIFLIVRLQAFKTATRATGTNFV